MITMIILVLLLSSGSVFAASFFKKRYEVSLPFTLMGIMVTLFLFALAGFLQIGLYVLLAAMVLCYPIALAWAIRQKDLRGFLSRLVTPGCAAFFLIFLIIWIGNRGRDLMAIDEFRMWGAVVRVMLHTNALASSQSSALWETVKSYPPGMAMFQYFWMKVSGTFADANLFRSYQIYCFALLLPALRGLDWKHWKKALILIPLAFIIPLVFFGSNEDGNFYTNIFIDPALGMMFGFAVYFIFLSSKSKAIDFAGLALILATLVLMKETGLALAIIALALYYIDLFTHRGWGKLIINKKNEPSAIKNRLLHLAVLLALLAVPLILESIWQKYLVVNVVVPKFTAVTLTGIIQSFMHPKVQFSHLVGIFASALSQKAVTGSLIKLSWVAIVTAMVGSVALISQSLSGALRARFRTVSIGLIVGCMAYTAGLLWMYLYQFPESEALVLASFSRYLSIYFCAVSVFLYLFISHCILCADIQVQPAKLKTAAAILCVAVFIITPITAESGILALVGGGVSTGVTLQQTPQAVASVIEKELKGKPGKVYVLMQGEQNDSANTYFCLRYLLLSTNVSINNEWWSWWLGEKTDNNQPINFVDELTKRVGDEYDYLLLMNINADFPSQAGSLFEGGEGAVQANCLYRVHREGNNILFVKAQ